MAVTTASEAQIKAQAKYDKAHTKRLSLKFNLATDYDILKHLDNAPNKQGYIKALIRADIKRRGKND